MKEEFTTQVRATMDNHAREVLTSQPSMIQAVTPSPTQKQLHAETLTPILHPNVTSTEDVYSSTPPTYSELIVIGRSVLDQPLEVFRFGNGSNRRMVIAGIHGGAEINTIALADEMIGFFDKNPNRIPTGVSLYILRSLNPDGEARTDGPEGRANQNGVDLNRNWDAFWQADPNLSGCWSIYKLSTGEFPQSEPETQALASFLLETEIDALISYHSAGQGIYAGGQPSHPYSIRLAEQLSMVSGYPYPPIDAGCVYTGQLIDWAVRNGIPAVDIELPNKRDTQLDTNLKILDVFVRWER